MKIRFGHSAVFLLCLLALDAGAYSDMDCLKCHDVAGQGSMLKISAEQFNGSVHGGMVSCQECHAGVVDDDHQETIGSGAVNCLECHDQVNRHGSAMTENRPKCFACHTRHDIRATDDPRSSVHAERLQQTCRTCHAAQSGAVGYLSRFPGIQIASHPKQDFSLVYTRSNCLGCHQGSAAHGESAPVSDQNCYVCHLDDGGRNNLLGVMHPEADIESQPGVFIAALMHQAALTILVLGGFGWLMRRFTTGSKRKE